MERVFNVEGALHCLISYLNEYSKGLEDSAKKRSHEGKPLTKHVKECWNLADEILRKLGPLNEELRQFCFSLCVVHDIGKLDSRWQIGKRGIRHARKSGELLQSIKGELTRLLPLPDGYQASLILATLRHHSPLFVTPKRRNLGRELSSLLSTDEELNVPLAVNIADTIGVFKWADIMSALNASPNFRKLLLSQYEWSNRIGTNIVHGIKRKAEEKCGFDPIKYELQNEIASSSCKHLTIVAPTGWGKTALGLLRIKHIKPNKVFYVLPTITAIKEFEQSLRNMFGSDYVGEYFYFADVEYLSRRKILEEEHIYPIDFYRCFIPKNTITTIDQLLLTTLQFGKYHLRRFNLMKSLLIFDEFHLFTPQMIGALKVIFEDLAPIYDFSVLLMSATPSASYIKELEEALRDQGGIQVNVLENEYRRLRRHDIKQEDMHLLDFIQEKNDEFKEKRVLVISNTVDRAVQAYNLLQEGAGEHKVRLIHGRFAYGDRAKRENEARGADILVSTQVAEVSLDISYDILITELAPIPSLVQRFGRVNRYGKCTKKKNVYICTSASEKPYSILEYIATIEILPKLEESLKKEGEKIYLNILNSYYRIILQEDGGIEKMYNKAKKTLSRKKYFYCVRGAKDFSEMFGREANYLAVPSCYYYEVRKLKNEMKGKTYKKYEERRRLLACMKKYFISVPSYVVKEDGKWDDDLHLYILSDKKYKYNPKRGLVKI